MINPVITSFAAPSLVTEVNAASPAATTVEKDRAQHSIVNDEEQRNSFLSKETQSVRRSNESVATEPGRNRHNSNVDTSAETAQLSTETQLIASGEGTGEPETATNTDMFEANTYISDNTDSRIATENTDSFSGAETILDDSFISDNRPGSNVETMPQAVLQQAINAFVSTDRLTGQPIKSVAAGEPSGGDIIAAATGVFEQVNIIT